MSERVCTRARACENRGEVNGDVKESRKGRTRTALWRDSVESCHCLLEADRLTIPGNISAHGDRVHVKAELCMTTTSGVR